MQLSEQQTAIIDWTVNHKGSAVVIARAGCGKTFTAIEQIKAIIENNLGDAYVGAFNRSIADEVKAKVEKFASWKQVAVNTAHGFGNSAIRKAFPKTKLDDKKVIRIVDRIVDEKNPDRDPDRVCVEQIVGSQIAQLVGFAKQAGFGFTGGALVNATDRSRWFDLVDHFGINDIPDGIGVGELVDSAIVVLKRSHDLDPEVIDFDDMVLVPLTRQLKVWQRDWVFIDEAQDTNAARRALFQKMLKPRGRLVAIGDDRQAINGFAGADNDALDQIRRAFGCETLSLTTTYRCPKTVVAAASEYVSDIIAHDTAPDGEVGRIESLMDVNGKMVSWTETVKFDRTDAILCRKTAPLIDAAYSLIRNGTPCRVEGREIGQGLIKLARRWKIATIATLLKRLDDHLDRETQKWRAKDRDDRAQAVADKVETLQTICEKVIEDGKTRVDDVVDFINGMFADTKGDQDVLTLSTVHKSKGREWQRVFALGANVWMPSPWARKEWEVVQEENLVYVMITRAQRELVFVDVIEDAG